MRLLKGIPVSPGIAVGRVHIIEQEEHIIHEVKLTNDDDIKREISNFGNALDVTKKELQDVKRKLVRHAGAEEEAILDAQIRLLSDPLIVNKTVAAIKADKKNAAFIFKQRVEEVLSSLQSVKDKYLLDRVHEIRDIYHRVLNHLLEDYPEGILSISGNEKILLGAHSLPPYEFVHFAKKSVFGVVTEVGGETSHFSIIARAFEIPAVVGCEQFLRFAKTGQTVIVDGFNGHVVLNPDAATLERYNKLKEKWRLEVKQLLLIKDLPCETEDGKLVDLSANVELPTELDSVISHGAKSIGLCRTEFLFMLRPKQPEEEEQFNIYRDYLERMKSGFVVIRTLDIGGDKITGPSANSEREANPAMGFRAVRLCLDDTKLFRTQLRAILRASVYGQLKIMFPMVSTYTELKKVLDFYRSIEKELINEKIPVASNIEVGTMIEVPAAALCAEALAKEVDFFSIGTNDLAQFMLAVDRGNKSVAHLYDPLNPALLRMIQFVVNAGHKKGIWVGVCGEMAGHPLTALILLGMGVDELSMNPASILEIKKLFRSVSYDEMRSLVKHALLLESASEIRLFFQKELRRKVNLASRLNSMFGI